MSKKEVLRGLLEASRDPEGSAAELAEMADAIADEIVDVADLVAVAEEERTTAIVQAIGAPISRCGWDPTILDVDVHVVIRYVALALQFPTSQTVGASLNGLLSLTLQHSEFRLDSIEQGLVSSLISLALDQWSSSLDTYLMNTAALQLLRNLGDRPNRRQLIGDEGLTRVGASLHSRREALLRHDYSGGEELFRGWPD